MAVGGSVAHRAPRVAVLLWSGVGVLLLVAFVGGRRRAAARRATARAASSAATSTRSPRTTCPSALAMPGVDSDRRRARRRRAARRTPSRELLRSDVLADDPGRRGRSDDDRRRRRPPVVVDAPRRRHAGHGHVPACGRPARALGLFPTWRFAIDPARRRRASPSRTPTTFTVGRHTVDPRGVARRSRRPPSASRPTTWSSPPALYRSATRSHYLHAAPGRRCSPAAPAQRRRPSVDAAADRRIHVRRCRSSSTASSTTARSRQVLQPDRMPVRRRDRRPRRRATRPGRSSATRRCTLVAGRRPAG